MNYRAVTLLFRAMVCITIIVTPFLLKQTSAQQTELYCAALDASAYAEVMHLIKQHHSIEAIVHGMQQTYPHLYMAQLKYTGNKRILLFKEHAKLCRINGTTILYANGACITPKNISAIDESLWNIAVNGTNITDEASDLIAWWGTVPDTIIETFAINWRSAHHIVLTARSCPQWRIYVTHDTGLDEGIIERAQQAYESVHPLQKNNQSLIADLRFKGQIVIYKEGEWNEKRVIS